MDGGSVDTLVRGLNAFLMMAVGLGLGTFIARRWRQPWGLYGIGAVTFVLSQVGHIPFNTWVLKPLLARLGWTDLSMPGALLGIAAAVGLSAGIFEETARWLMYRFWARRARRWDGALMVGAGHGGIEAILLGLLAAYALIQVLALRGADLASVVPADRVEIARQQIQAYWAAPWYAALLGSLERAFALCLHLSLSVMVLQTFTRRRWQWLGLAIGWHALVDAMAVVALQQVGPYWTEALVGVFAAISLGIVYALRSSEREPEPSPATPTVAPPIARGEEKPPTREQLDDSRFAGGAG